MVVRDFLKIADTRYRYLTYFTRPYILMYKQTLTEVYKA